MSVERTSRAQQRAYTIVCGGVCVIVLRVHKHLVAEPMAYLGVGAYLVTTCSRTYLVWAPQWQSARTDTQIAGGVIELSANHAIVDGSLLGCVVWDIMPDLMVSLCHTHTHAFQASRMRKVHNKSTSAYIAIHVSIKTGYDGCVGVCSVFV